MNGAMPLMTIRRRILITSPIAKEIIPIGRLDPHSNRIVYRLVCISIGRVWWGMTFDYDHIANVWFISLRIAKAVYCFALTRRIRVYFR
jgi:hypothetical protein